MPQPNLYDVPWSDREKLRQIVRSVRNRRRLRLLLRGLALLLLTAAALVLAAGFVIDVSRFDATTVQVARILAYLALFGMALRFLVWPFATRVDDERVALYLEEHEPGLDGRVSSALELGTREGAGTSSALMERLVESAVEECRKVEDGKRVERPALLRSTGMVAGSTVSGFGLFLLGPAFLQHTTPVLLDPFKKAEAHSPYRIHVEPGDTTLASGSDLRISAILENFDAGEVELRLRENTENAAAGEWQRWTMLREDDPKIHSLMVFDLDQPTEYYVEASGVRSRRFQIEVQELPYVEKIGLTYRFPAYTGLDPIEQDDSGDIAALAGTEVRLRIKPTFPVPGGAIDLEGGQSLPLEVTSDGELWGTMVVREPGSYRVRLESAEGELLVASPDYVIDLFEDQPPVLTLSKPGRDLRVTSLEEVALEVRAADDYGVARVEIAYSVNGGEETSALLYRGSPGRKEFLGTHTLFLEEHELVPGDLIAYYARARDGYEAAAEGDDRLEETVTDIYFLEIRPFDRNLRQADQGGQGQAMGMSGDELTAQQRMIISATFKLARGLLRSTEDRNEIATIAMSQGRLRDEVEGLVNQLRSRGFTEPESPVAQMTELLPLAVEEMTRAEEALGEHRPGAALSPEQKALQYLQRAEAAFRDLRIAQGQQGGGGGGHGIDEELAELFEQERDRLKNQYEEVRRGRQQNADHAIDETLEKLRELARRQQQENERMRARARQAERSTRAGSSGRSQRQLAEEAEEVARRLERLAREESLPELAETAQQLRRAAEEMRRAAAAGERAEEVLGEAALDRLRQARRQLEGNKSGRLRRDTDQALERVRRLRQQQERMADRVGELDPAEPGHPRDLQSLLEAKERMGSEIGQLEGDLDQLSRGALRDQPEAARRLKEAAGTIRDERIREKILYSRGVVQERSRDYAIRFEEHIEAQLRELEGQLEEAFGAIGESREDRLGRALEETREATAALESLSERLADGQAGGASSDSEASSGHFAPRGDVRQQRRELRRRRDQLTGLSARLRREGVETTDLESILGRLRDLESKDDLASSDTLAILEREVIRSLKEFEYSLRRSLRPAQDDRRTELGGEDVPEGYEEMVEKYYKALAEGK